MSQCGSRGRAWGVGRLRAGMDIYTRKGDDGTTGLLYGGRVRKDDPRPAAYGDVDEAPGPTRRPRCRSKHTPSMPPMS